MGVRRQLRPLWTFTTDWRHARHTTKGPEIRLPGPEIGSVSNGNCINAVSEHVLEHDRFGMCHLIKCTEHSFRTYA